MGQVKGKLGKLIISSLVLLIVIHGGLADIKKEVPKNTFPYNHAMENITKWAKERRKGGFLVGGKFKEGFEDRIFNFFSHQAILARDQTKAHSGKYSLRVTPVKP